MLRLLLARSDADLSAKNRRGQTPLALASRLGSIEALDAIASHVQLLIEGERSVASKLIFEAAVSAAVAGKLDLAQRLLKHSGNVTIAQRRHSVLRLVFQERTEALRLLLDAGVVDINDSLYGTENATMIVVAAQNRRHEVVEFAAAYDGVDPNVHSYYGLTPLHSAALNGDSKVARIILSAKGVDVNRADFLGRTPLA